MTDPKTGAGGDVSPPNPWDPLVRITHWLVALAVVLNGIVTEGGSVVHIWIGWAVMTLLAVRFIWGFVGPREARFTAFPPNPRAAMAHLGDLMRGKAREHHSHNPAGALMVYALWGSLVIVAATGLVMTDARSPLAIAEEKAAVASGDWSVLVDDDGGAHGEREDRDGGGKIAEEVHEVFANLLLLLAALHLAGVVVESRALGRNIVQPMLKGQRKP